MRFLTARRLALVAMFPALLVFSVIPGCASQGEGERCDGDVDCASGLVCTSTLLNYSQDKASRCCYPNRVTDVRCTVGTGQSASAGASNSGGAAGSAGAVTSGGSSGANATGGNSQAQAGAAGDPVAAEAGAGGG